MKLMFPRLKVMWCYFECEGAWGVGGKVERVVGGSGRQGGGGGGGGG